MKIIGLLAPQYIVVPPSLPNVLWINIVVLTERMAARPIFFFGKSGNQWLRAKMTRLSHFFLKNKPIPITNKNTHKIWPIVIPKIKYPICESGSLKNSNKNLNNE